MVVALVAAIPLALLSGRYWQIRQQQVVASEFESRGCIVIYSKSTAIDAWLERLLGNGTFSRCVYLEAPAGAFDADLAALRSLPDLESLYLSGRRITDAGVPELGNLQRLTDLWLDQTEVTDDGLRQLRGLPRLTRLTLTASRVTDAGVERLQQELPQLTIVKRD